MTNRTRTPKTRWKEICQREIQEAALRILSREGSSRLTMGRVAEEAGVAKGTIYAHFKDKRRLLEAVRERSVQPMRAELFAILEGSLPPDQKIRRLISRQLGYLDEHRDLFRVLLWERQLPGGLARRRHASRYMAYVGRIAGVLEEGVQQEAFRPMDCVKVAAMLVEASMALISRRLWEVSPCPVERDAELLTEVFMGGIATGASGRETAA